MKIERSDFSAAHLERISFFTAYPIGNMVIEIFDIITNKSTGVYYVDSKLDIRNINSGKIYSSNKKLKNLAYIYLYGDVDTRYFIDNETNILYDCYHGIVSGVDGRRFDNTNYFSQFKIDIDRMLDHIKLINLFEIDIVFTKREIVELINTAYSEGYAEHLGTSNFKGDRLKFIISLFQQKIDNQKHDYIFTIF